MSLRVELKVKMKVIDIYDGKFEVSVEHLLIYKRFLKR